MWRVICYSNYRKLIQLPSSPSTICSGSPQNIVLTSIEHSLYYYLGTRSIHFRPSLNSFRSTMNGPQIDLSLNPASAHFLRGGGAMLSEVTKRLEEVRQQEDVGRKRVQGLTEEMSKAKEKGDNEVREEKEGKGDRGRSGSLMVGDKREREKQEEGACSLLSHLPLTTLSACFLSSSPLLGSSSSVSSLRGSHDSCPLEYVEKLFIQLDRPRPEILI